MKPTQPGRFLATVAERESYVFLAKDDKPTIIIPLLIENGQGENSGTEITWFGGLGSEKQIDFTRKQLKSAFGWEWNAQELADNTVPFAGREIEVKIEWNHWNGVKSLKATFINNPDGEAIIQDPKKIASILGALDRQISRNSKPSRPIQPKMVKASDPIELEDDDIPF